MIELDIDNVLHDKLAAGEHDELSDKGSSGCGSGNSIITFDLHQP